MIRLMLSLWTLSRLAVTDPATAAQRWATGLGNATQKITEGVQAVTVAPGQAAARQKAVWAQNTAAAQDKWAANTAAVPLASWQNDMVQKGVSRIAGGAQAAQPKMAAVFTQLLPYIDSQVRQLPARGTLDQNINRAVSFIRGMSNFKMNRQGL